MRTEDNVNYFAEKGKLILRTEDNFVMGDSICLGDADSIDNYYEDDCNEEGYTAFFASIGEDVESDSFKAQLAEHFNKE